MASPMITHVLRSETHEIRKTRMCSFFARGCCTRGNACTFAHCEGQLSSNSWYKTRLCRKLLHDGECTSATCGYAHSVLELRVGTEPVRKSCDAAELTNVPQVPTPTQTISGAGQQGSVSDRSQLALELQHLQEQARFNQQREDRNRMLRHDQPPRQRRPGVRMRQRHVFASDAVPDEEIYLKKLCREVQSLSPMDQLALLQRLSMDLTCGLDHVEKALIRQSHNTQEAMLEALAWHHREIVQRLSPELRLRHSRFGSSCSNCSTNIGSECSGNTSTSTSEIESNIQRLSF